MALEAAAFVRLMEETYRIKAIVLSRRPYREHDLSVTLYSLERGKQVLVARGARKFRSKLAAHIEPLCLIEGLVVRGRTHDYLGSASARTVWPAIKGDLDKLAAASAGAAFFEATVREGQTESQMFYLLRDFFAALEAAQPDYPLELLPALFKFKLRALAGYELELRHCLVCGRKLKPGGNRLSLAKNGLACPACLPGSQALTISDESVKILRLAMEYDLAKFLNIKISPESVREVSHLVNLLTDSN